MIIALLVGILILQLIIWNALHCKIDSGMCGIAFIAST